jgi:hypothetical protein
MTPEEERAFCRRVEVGVSADLVKRLADATARALLHGGSILDK